LSRYVDRFNARDFDSLRMMLADEVRLDLIGRTKLRGAAEISDNYFHRYNEMDDWRFGVGTVEGRPAILGYDLSQESSQPAYFILLTWEGDQVSLIRDYFYARYIMQDAAITPM
jgi:RNA polymerase sigma-70 factor, ECF subfamily